MRSPAARAILGLVLVSSWLALLLSGLTFGGAVHLLLAAALVLFPWRAAAGSHLPVPPLPAGEEAESKR